IESVKEKFDNKLSEFESSFSKKDKDFSDKITSLQTLLGSSQASATQIEGIKNNVISLETKILSIQSEYEASKNKYIEEEEKYNKLVLSIDANKSKLEHSINELGELKKSKEEELNVITEELDYEKEKIKDILGDANRASMAQSFLDRKKELNTPIYNSAFWRNIGLVLMSGLILVILIVEWNQESFDYFRFFSRLPVVMPLLWLVWSNSQRNNHLIRVQEEYAYKAAVAIAFEGYKRKVDEINDVDLKKLLLELSVTNMGNNPVNLFDKNTKISPFDIDKIIGKFFDKGKSE
ncbi:TPA: coiled-coil domain-containing protein, partial [Haemophilus influenzae]